MAHFSRWRRSLTNNILIALILAAMLLPIALTLLTSFKREADVLRKPPVLLPCDAPDGSWGIQHCRFVLEGHERVLIPASTRLVAWL